MPKQPSSILLAPWVLQRCEKYLQLSCISPTHESKLEASFYRRVVFISRELIFKWRSSAVADLGYQVDMLAGGQHDPDRNVKD